MPENWEGTIRIMLLLIICMIIGKSLALPTIATTPSQNDETDGEVSRKILGSSVVTSVSVITDHGNGSKTFYSDAVGKPLPKPFVGSQLASPINLLNPDRYEFYTFDDNGDLVKRLMTLDEIQSIIASGDGDTSYNSNFWAPGEPEKRVEDVVNNVQNVLKEEMEAHKITEKKPVLVGPQITSNWNLILPPIFSNLPDNSLDNNSTNASTEKIVTEPELFSAKTESPDVPVITVEITNQSQNVTKEAQPNVATTSTYEKTQSPQKLETVQLTTWVPSYSPTVFVPSSPSPFSLVSELTAGSTLNQFTSTAVPSTLEDLQFSTTYYNKLTTQQAPTTTQYGDLSTFFYVEHEKQPTKQENTGSTSYTYLDLQTGTYKTTNDAAPSAKTETVQETSTSKFETTANFRTEEVTTKKEELQENIEGMLTTTQEIKQTTQDRLEDKLVLTSTSQDAVKFTTQNDPEDYPSTVQELKTTTQNVPTATEEKQALSTAQTVQDNFESTSEEKQASTIQEIKTTDQEAASTVNFNKFSTTLQSAAATNTEQPLLDTTVVENEKIPEQDATTSKSMEDLAVTQLLNQLLQSTNAYEINNQLLGETTPKFDSYTTVNQRIAPTTFQHPKTDDELELISTSNSKRITNTPTTASPRETTFEYTSTPISDTLGQEEVNLAVDSLLSQVISQYPTTIEDDMVQTTSSGKTTSDVETTHNEAPTEKEETQYELLTTNNAKSTARPTTVVDLTTNDYKTRYDEVELEQPLRTTNFQVNPEVATTAKEEQTTSQEASEAPTTRENTQTTFQSNQTPANLQNVQTTSDVQNDAPITQQTDDFTQLSTTSSEQGATTFSKKILNNADNYKKITQEVHEPFLTFPIDSSSESADYTSTENIELLSTKVNENFNLLTNIVTSRNPEISTLEGLSQETELSTVLPEAQTAAPDASIFVQEDLAEPSEVSTSAPEAPTDAPEVQTDAPEAQTAAPEAPTAAPEAPTAEPDVPTAATEAPTAEPDVPTAATEALTAATEAPTAEPEVPTAPAEAPTAAPEAPTAAPEAPTAAPKAPTAAPEALTFVTEAETPAPEAPTTVLPVKPLATTEVPTLTSGAVESSTTETNDLFVTVPIFTTSPKINKQPEYKVVLNTTSSTSTQPPETTWTLVSTVLPHKTEVEKLKQNHSIPTSVDLVPRPLQGYGLEDSTSGLDTDVFQFTELCNELAFSFWSSVTTGISFARSVVVSPFAMTSMLAMVFLGARGSTSGEMNDILKLDDMVTFNPHAIFRNVVESIEVSKKSGVAVSVFARELYSDKNKGKLLGFYKERVKQFYDGHVEEVNFKEINDVVKKRTNLLVKRYTWGKISEFLKDSNLFVRPPLAAVSANIFQTDCSQASVEGRDGELHFVVLPSIRQRKLIPIPAVLWRSGFLAGYDPGLDATAVAIGTKDSTVSTIFVIPGQQGISAPGDGLMRLENRLVENAYKQNAWNRLLRSLIPRPGLEVQIPRFSHKSIINATMALQRMGLKDLFNSRDADLKGLNGAAHEFYLSDIVQVNTFATCGEGKISESHHSEIYPATTNRSFRRIRKIHPRPVENNDNFEEPRDYQRAFHDPLFDPSYLALPLQLRPRQARLPEAPRLRFDRPFLYFVRHNPTGLILHMGRFNPRLLP